MKQKISDEIELRSSKENPLIVDAQLGDTGRILELSLFAEGKAFTPAPDWKAVFAAKKPDGTVLFNNCNILGSKVQYKFTEQTCAVADQYQAEIRFYDGEGDQITSVPFFMNIRDTIFHSGDDIEAKSELDAIDSFLKETQSVNTEIHKKLEDGTLSGESAYEAAVRLGFHGTEEQWLQSLRYDHSEEFQSLAAQVYDSLQSALSAADNSQTAASHARQAQTAAETSAGNALQYSEDAKQAQAAAKTNAGTARQYAAEALKSQEASKASASDAALAEATTQKCADAAKTDLAQKVLQADASAVEAARQAEAAKQAAERIPAEGIANALTKTVIGKTILLEDISPIPHRIRCKISSKNLLSYPYADKTKEVNGVKITDNGDGTITVKGTPTAYTDFLLISTAPGKRKFIPAGTYTCSGNPTSSILAFYFYADSSSKNPTTSVLITNNQSKVITLEKDSYMGVYWAAREEDKGVDGIIKPQIELGETATQFTRYIEDFSKIYITRLGSNLISNYRDTEKISGVTFTSRQDGTIELNGIAETDIVFILKSYPARSSKNHPLYLSGIPASRPGNIALLVILNDTEGYQTPADSGKGVMINYNAKVFRAQINIPKGAELNNVIVSPTLSYSNSKKYTPYIEPLELKSSSNGIISSLYSSNTAITVLNNHPEVLINLEYNCDSNFIIGKLLSRISALENLLTAAN